MWVQLRGRKQIEIHGKPRTYIAGDWVDVGKQTALLWISEGSAWIPESQAVNLMSNDCGVFVWGNARKGEAALGDYAGKVEFQAGDTPRLPWGKTMIYSPGLRLRNELVPIGFHLLDTWQVAIPLFDYEKLACQQGSEEERARTEAIVRDLRVPMYSPDLLFLRRCGDTEKFIAQWNKEMKDGGDKRLSLLRALYIVKPLILALPTTWIWKNMGEM